MRKKTLESTTVMVARGARDAIGEEFRRGGKAENGGGGGEGLFEAITKIRL